MWKPLSLSRSMTRSVSLLGSGTCFPTLLLALLGGDALGLGLGLLAGDLLFADLLVLDLVDGLDEHGLVLVLVALGAEVEVVVHMLVDLLRFSVLLQQSSQHSLATHPQHFLRHASISCSFSLSNALMTS